MQVLGRFIALYCHSKHRDQGRTPVKLKACDVQAIYGKPLNLCPSCQKLLAHAFAKRGRCPLDPKPDCRKCPVHCYAPKYRAQIREVMKYSGPRLVIRGRLGYLLHLIGWRPGEYADPVSGPGAGDQLG